MFTQLFNILKKETTNATDIGATYPVSAPYTPKYGKKKLKITGKGGDGAYYPGSSVAGTPYYNYSAGTIMSYSTYTSAYGVTYPNGISYPETPGNYFPWSASSFYAPTFLGIYANATNFDSAFFYIVVNQPSSPYAGTYPPSGNNPTSNTGTSTTISNFTFPGGSGGSATANTTYKTDFKPFEISSIPVSLGNTGSSLTIMTYL